jgi:hypothetical protein|tara:strand:+ start:1342 stop:1749 length:408 start_codon:yes stop_codon:yes gene_type:complete
VDISLTATVALVFSSRPFQTVANDPRPIGWLFSEEKIAYSFPVFAFLIILVLLVLGVFDDEVGCLGRLGTDIFFEFIPKPARSDAKKNQLQVTQRYGPARAEMRALRSYSARSFLFQIPSQLSLSLVFASKSFSV